MGATSYIYLVPSDKIPKDNWPNQALADISSYNVLPENPFLAMDNVEDEIGSLVIDYGENILFVDGPELIFELNKSNIGILITRCKSLIMDAIAIETDDEGKKSIVGKVLNHWDEDVPLSLTFLLRTLRDAKKELMQHDGYSLVIRIAY